MTIGKRSPASRRHAPNALPDAASGPLPASAPADRLDAAAGLVAAASVLIALAVVVAAADGLREAASFPAEALRLYRALDLNDLALTPAGRRERRAAPGAIPIDWRFLPTLPQQDPGLIRLLEAERLSGSTVSPP